MVGTSKAMWWACGGLWWDVGTLPSQHFRAKRYPPCPINKGGMLTRRPSNT